MPDQSIPSPAGKRPRGRPRLANPTTNSSRQKTFQAKIRGLTPVLRLARASGLGVDGIYTAMEQGLIAEFWAAERIAVERAGRLNTLLQGRMLARSEDPDLTPGERQAALDALAELAKVWRITLPAF